MPRNMSFALTTEQIKNRTKTVTRRFGWLFLKPGDEVYAVEKSLGLKKGEKIVHLAHLRILSAQQEPLNNITYRECGYEGFPHYTPGQFINMLRNHYKKKIDSSELINRIEFEYID